jgi:hypothetical protein
MTHGLGRWVLAAGCWAVVALAAQGQQGEAAKPAGAPAQAAAGAAKDAPAGTGTKFIVGFDPGVQTAPYSGRVYVVLANVREPRLKMSDWFNRPQVFALDVKDVPVGGSVLLNGAGLAHPRALADVPAGVYTVQAVARRNPDHWMPGVGEGDLISEAMDMTWPIKPGEAVPLVLDRAVTARAFKETERVKLVEVPSKLLSDFHGRPVTLRAGVILPQGWSEKAERTWPAAYFIGGFGSDHRVAQQMGGQVGGEANDVLIVVPSAGNYWGHSVFADSANTGPWGRAFIEELIPAVEKRFKGPAAPGGGGGGQRYVFGVSSGGWASLWVQVTYPDAFNGCWAHVPDPVDFRDFQRINLYAPNANMYVDEQGHRRPLARRNGEVALYYQDFVAAETVLGPGGQIGSFEAVFSPRGEDGQPRALFDRATGTVDPAVAKAWEAYDLRLVLERTWATRGEALKGKIRVYAGEQDNFYLEGAARLLKESMAKLDPSAVVEIVAGMGHGMHREGARGMYRFIAEHAIKPAQAPAGAPGSPAAPSSPAAPGPAPGPDSPGAPNAPAPGRGG